MKLISDTNLQLMNAFLLKNCNSFDKSFGVTTPLQASKVVHGSLRIEATPFRDADSIPEHYFKLIGYSRTDDYVAIYWNEPSFKEEAFILVHGSNIAEAKALVELLNEVIT